MADATIYSSEKIVTKANDYFSTRWKIPEIPRKIGLPHELAEKRYKLEDNNRKSEQILEIETSTSILASDGIVYSLWREVKELRKDIKKLEGLKSLDRRLQMLEDRTSFIEALKTFAGEMGKKYWKVFWGTIGEKFLPNPERLAQSHLGMFLNGTFYSAAFVGVEIRSGNGFIDVFVYFFGNAKIIEMKMVGLSWALSEAEDGIRQFVLLHENSGKGNSFSEKCKKKAEKTGQDRERIPWRRGLPISSTYSMFHFSISSLLNCRCPSNTVRIST